MPPVVGFDRTFLVPSFAALGSFLVGMAVLNTEVAIQEDQGKNQEKENGNAYSYGYNSAVW